MIIKGKIVNGQTKEPLAFANVVPSDAKGNQIGNRGTTTNIDGNYSIELSEGEYLTVSYVGFKRRTIMPTSTTVNINMEPMSAELPEVVITGKKKRKGLVYAGIGIGLIAAIVLIAKTA